MANPSIAGFTVKKNAFRIACRQCVPGSGMSTDKDRTPKALPRADTTSAVALRLGSRTDDIGAYSEVYKRGLREGFSPLKRTSMRKAVCARLMRAVFDT
jgi:hypothetical protein